MSHALKSFLKQKIDPVSRSKMRLVAHNMNAAVNRKAMKLGFQSFEDVYVVEAGPDKIYVAQPHRWQRYKFGIQARIQQLGRTYGVPDFVQIAPGDTVIDFGANIGEFSLLCASLGAKSYAIEADERVYKCLQRNTHGHNIQTVRQALWHEETTLRFYSSISDSDSSLIEPEAYDTIVEIDALPLDRLVQDLKIPLPIKLIKGDAEGAEPEVLKGATETLKQTQFVSLDCGAERKGETTVDECADILKSHGFEIIRRENSGRYNLIGKNSTF